MSQIDDAPAADKDHLEGLYGVTDELVRAVQEAIEEERPLDVAGPVSRLHAADQADLIERLSTHERGILIAALGDRLDPDFFSHLDETVREEILERLDTQQLAGVITGLESDDAIDLIEDLEEDEQRELLDAIPAQDRAVYEQALRYPEDSAGRLMQHDAATVPSFWKIGQTIDYMRSGAARLPDDFYDIYVVGPTHRPIGKVPVSRLLRTKRPVDITAIMDEDLKPIPATMDQEDVAFLFRQYGLASAPVVDDNGRMVGVITVDDVVDVIHEEHEEDIFKLAGVGEDDFYEAMIDTTRRRFPWLMVNLGAAFIAAQVIGLFDYAIEKVVALAILMPIVASMGGNAGMQALTVAVRALAMKQLTPTNALRIVGKEVLVGGVNGILFAVMVGAIAWIWFGNPLIGGVIGAAMVINLICGGLVGILVPLILDRIGIDPALGSSVILTTTTDVVGFLSFLGLAALVLL